MLTIAKMMKRRARRAKQTTDRPPLDSLSQDHVTLALNFRTICYASLLCDTTSRPASGGVESSHSGDASSDGLAWLAGGISPPLQIFARQVALQGMFDVSAARTAVRCVKLHVTAMCSWERASTLPQPEL